MRHTVMLILFLLSASLYSWGQSEKYEKEPEPGDEIIVSGTLSMKGAEPFTFTALTLKNGTVYRLQGKFAVELLKQRGKGEITIRGTLLRKASPPGQEAVIEVKEYKVSSD